MNVAPIKMRSTPRAVQRSALNDSEGEEEGIDVSVVITYLCDTDYRHVYLSD